MTFHFDASSEFRTNTTSPYKFDAPCFAGYSNLSFQLQIGIDEKNEQSRKRKKPQYLDCQSLSHKNAMENK